MIERENIKVIGFDADDTLWINEPYFQETEDNFCLLLKEYAATDEVSRVLFEMEMKNLELYGYGAKGFMLSMVEAAVKVSKGNVPASIIEKTIMLGKEMLERPIELLDGVNEVLTALKGKYKLIVATKGDLLDQERKLRKSGLLQYFHHIEVMSDKKEADYSKLLAHLDCAPNQFLMIGNSLKSDVLPVLELGGNAIHVPYHTTWAHEKVEEENLNILKIDKLVDVLKFV
ncbi:HAD family hydrolase [Prolixibacteraceae bacterium JC049]|nr:HAD family hydrolase [Prolixibacteraceae bacterium JC049]